MGRYGLCGNVLEGGRANKTGGPTKPHTTATLQRDRNITNIQVKREMTNLIWVGLGGAGGSVMRYLASGLGQRLGGESFPTGTLLVKVVGCFLIGLLATLFEERMLISPQVRLLVLTGFLGGFTTFSTYGLETLQLARDGEWLLGMGNLLLSNLLGLAACWLGMRTLV